MDDDNHNIPEEPEFDTEEEKFNKFLAQPRIQPVQAAFFGLIGVFLLYQFGGALVALAIFGFDIQNADVNSLRLFTIGGQILLILLPALILSKFVYEDVTATIRFYLPKLIPLVLFTIGLVILTPLLQSYIYIQNHFIDLAAESSSFIQSTKDLLDQLDKLLAETYDNLLGAESIFEGSFVLFVVAVIPAVCEEIFFRGYVQKSFEYRIRPFWAAFITAVFFSFYHFNPYGFIPLTVLGLYFGFAAYKSNSILIPMFLHFINNFFAVVVFFIFGSEEIFEAEVTEVQNINEMVVGFIALSVLFGLLIYVIKKYYNSINHNKRETI